MRYVFLAIFAGCTALLLESMLTALVSRMLKPKGAKRITIITAYGCEDLERRLRWHLFELDTDVFSEGRLLLIVDGGVAGEDAEIVRRLCQGRRNCRFCKPSEIKTIIGCDAVCKAFELVLY